MRQVKVGVIGCGRIAQTVHIPNYIENSKSKLEAICDPNKDVLNSVAEKYKVRRAFHDHNELLESGLVEAVSVCVPTSLHSRIVIDAARRGIHALCEKPLASNLEEAEEMLAAVSSFGIKFMVGFNLRFMPNHIKTRQYLCDGKIGTPFLARAEMVAAGPYGPEIEIGSYRSETEKRIGCLFDLGSHLAYLMIWMFGKPSRVSACFSTHKDGIEVDDSAIVAIKFRNNIIGSIHVAWAHFPDVKAVESSRNLEIIGTNGKIESNCFGPSLYFYNTKSLFSRIRGRTKITPQRFDPRIPHEALAWSYKQEMDDFLRAIIHDREPSVSIEDGKEALKLILAAYQSSKLDSVVSME